MEITVRKSNYFAIKNNKYFVLIDQYSDVYICFIGSYIFNYITMEFRCKYVLNEMIFDAASITKSYYIIGKYIIKTYYYTDKLKIYKLDFTIFFIYNKYYYTIKNNNNIYYYDYDYNEIKSTNAIKNILTCKKYKSSIYIICN